MGTLKTLSNSDLGVSNATYRLIIPCPLAASGPSAVTAGGAFVAPYAGTVVDVYLGAVTNTTTGTTGFEFTPKKNGTALVSTAPKILDTAGTGVKKLYVGHAAGTGLTIPVLDSAQTTFAKGDVFTFDCALTNTPNATGACAGIVVQYNLGDDTAKI